MKNLRFKNTLGHPSKLAVLLAFFGFLSFSPKAFSQGVNCLGADPFCTGTTYTFPNSTGVADLGSVSCLGSTPNPAWYFMEIDQNGPMTIQVSQASGGSGLDVDFALWGPYSSLAAGCGGGTFPTGATVDCSYSTAAVEQVDIPGATIGQFYILLLTNFSNQPGTITFNQTGGAGSADCSFICGITSFTANPSACNPATNQYSLSGTITFTNPPTTGTLTITNSCGGSQVFNAPFGASANYNFTGLTSNGAGCTVSASFSANPACNTTTPYTAPASCLSACSITSVTATPSACTPATNQYSVSGSISFTGAPATGTLTVTGSCGGTQTFNAPFVSPLNYTLSGLTSNGAACTVTATFSATPACTNTANYTAPAACPPCSITNITANVSACSAATNTYNITGAVTFTNAPSTGTLTVTNSCGGSQTFNAPFVSPINYTISNINADGTTNCSVTAVFSAVPACTATVGTFTEPVCPCNMDFLQVNIGICDPATNTYTVDGFVQFTTPPSSGTLTITTCSGQTQTFNAPFTSPTNYSISGVPADGAACSVTATFSANPACTINLAFTSPSGCLCPADAGTYTTTITGSGTTNYVLCDGDQIDIVSNGDFTYPDDLFDPGQPYNPGIGYMLYSCPPTVLTGDITTDPCLVGVVGTTPGIFDINDMALINSFPPGTFTNNTVYFVPITFYDITSLTYSFTNWGGFCYDLGAPISVTYLPPIVVNGVEDCAAGTVTVTVSGGQPGLLGGNFTASGLSPATASLGNTTCGNNGTIVINGLQNGDMYSVTITDANGCPVTYTGGPFVGPTTPTITPAGPFCLSDPSVNLVASIAGGTWSGTGITNAAAGTFDPATAGVGTHTITYTPTGCTNPATINITVNTVFDATITPAGPFCESNANTFLAAVDPGGTWSGPGIVNAVTGEFSPASAGPGTHTITYTVGGGSCGDTQTTNIQVIADADATANPAGPFCLTDPSVNLTSVQAGGTWSGNGITSAATGTFDPATAGLGTHTITYTISGVCGDAQTINIQVIDTANTTITQVGPYCAQDPAVTLQAAQAGGIWSGTGITNANTGTFDPAVAGPGTHTITYTISGNCGNSSTIDIVVNPMPVVTFTVDNPTGCAPLTATVTNTSVPVGTNCQWTIDGAPVAGASCASFTQTFNNPGCYDIGLTVSDANGCTSSGSVNDMICVIADPVADFTWGPTDATVLNPMILFTNTSTGAVSYSWDFGDGGTSTAVNPSHVFPDSSATYTVCLGVANAAGCTDSICQTVIIYDEFIVYVPNTFTPDGDGKNDIFLPIVSGHDPLSFEFYIFDRWGELIFESHSNQVGWDGTHKAQMAKQDVYVWKLKVKAANGGDKKEFYGHVTLLK